MGPIGSHAAVADFLYSAVTRKGFASFSDDPPLNEDLHHV